MAWSKEQKDRFEEFLAEIKEIAWFENGTQINRNYTVLTSIYEAHEVLGDEEQCVWEKESIAINDTAVKALGDKLIDEVFYEVSQAIGEELWDKLCDFEEMLEKMLGEQQGGVEEDITDFIKRDTAWACVEYILGIKGFFTKVYNINKAGRFACSWSGNYPLGHFVIM